MSWIRRAGEFITLIGATGPNRGHNPQPIVTMNIPWENLVENPKERKVLEALSDPRWNYRTIEGIKKDTGLTELEIEAILQKYRNRLVHKAAVPDKFGRELYTLARAQSEIMDMLLKLRTFMGKTFD